MVKGETGSLSLSVRASVDKAVSLCKVEIKFISELSLCYDT